MGRFQPGQSGNPFGRPPKNRSLTDILEKAGNKTVLDSVTNRRVARKRIVARCLWQLAAEGKTRLPSGEELILDPSDWIGMVKWIYSHIDGPPKAEFDVTSRGESIVLDGKQYDRAILTLADAVREKVPGTNGGSNGSVGSAE